MKYIVPVILVILSASCQNEARWYPSADVEIASARGGMKYLSKKFRKNYKNHLTKNKAGIIL